MGATTGDSHSGVVGWCAPLSAIDVSAAAWNKVESDNQAKLCSRVRSRTLDVMTPSPRHGNRRRPAPSRGAKVAFDPRTLTERAIDGHAEVAWPSRVRTEKQVRWSAWSSGSRTGRWRLPAEANCGTATTRSTRYWSARTATQAAMGRCCSPTLEPCAPGRATGIPSSVVLERIVLARIKEVWIGIEDPDPTVDRKGIKFTFRTTALRSTCSIGGLGNDQSREQGVHRASVRASGCRTLGKEKPERIALSPLEGRIANVNTNDLSTEALARYRRHRARSMRRSGRRTSTVVSSNRGF